MILELLKIYKKRRFFMKKKMLKVLSFLLVALQTVILFSAVPASAANSKSYVIYKTDKAPTADGLSNSESEAWDSIPWSDTFKKTAKSDAPEGFSAKFKMMWYENTATSAVELWFYVYVNDGTVTGQSTTNWTNDYFALSVADASSKKLYSNGRVEIGLLPEWESREGNAEYEEESAKNKSSYPDIDVDLGWRDMRASEGYYTVEYMVSVPASKLSGEIRFDIMINDCITVGSDYSRNAWCSMNNTDIASPEGIGILSKIPASAADKVSYDPYTSKEYTIYNAGQRITVDGNAENDSAWSNAEWGYLKRSSITNVSGQLEEQEGLEPKFKAMWYNEDGNAYLYLLISVNDTRDPNLATWITDGFQFAIDETAKQVGNPSNNTHVINCSTPLLFTSNSRREVTLDLDYQYTRDENGYTVEAVYQFVDAGNCDGNIRFDVLVQDNLTATSGNCYARYTYGGMYDVSNLPITKGAIGVISPYTSADNAPIKTEKGAGIRLDSPAGLRFESRINKAKYDELSANAQITVGTLVVPTDYLEAYGINSGTGFTKKNLDAIGIPYLDIVNDGWNNAATADEDGYYGYYGSIVGIKEGNLDRNFSGIGYMTVKTESDEYTVYGGYSSDNHSRSVQSVASAALESGEYEAYTELLMSFIRSPQSTLSVAQCATVNENAIGICKLTTLREVAI